MVADGQGRVVLAEFGGHVPIDSAWAERMRQPHGVVDFALRREELKLAAEVADALVTDARLDPESRILTRGLAASVRVTLDGYDEGPEVVADAEPTTTKGVDTVVPGETATIEKAATYVHQVYIRRAVCCWNTNDHSATRLRIFNSAGVLLSDLKRRNHGRWVDDPSMGNAAGCPRSFSGRTNQTPFFSPYVGSDTFLNGRAGGCPTSYGTLPGQHVCTDDSFAQYNYVKSNPFILPIQPYATCSDSTLRAVSPTCN